MKSEQQIKDRIEELKEVKQGIIKSLDVPIPTIGVFTQLGVVNSKIHELENILKED